MPWPFTAGDLASYFANTNNAAQSGDILGIPGALLSDAGMIGARVLAPVQQGLDEVSTVLGPLSQRFAGAYEAGKTGFPSAATNYDLLVQQEQQAQINYQLWNQMHEELARIGDPTDPNNMKAALSVYMRYGGPEMAMRAIDLMQKMNPKATGRTSVQRIGGRAIAVMPDTGTHTAMGVPVQTATPEGQLAENQPQTPGLIFPNAVDPEDVTRVQSLWTAKPQVQAWEKMMQLSASVEQAYQQFQQEPTGPAYLALAKAVNAMTSSATSVELQLPEEYEPLLSKLESLYTRAATGAPSPEVAKNLVDTSRALVAGAAAAVKPAWEGYKGLATQIAKSWSDNPQTYAQQVYLSSLRNPDMYLRQRQAPPAAPGPAPARSRAPAPRAAASNAGPLTPDQLAPPSAPPLPGLIWDAGRRSWVRKLPNGKTIFIPAQ